MKQLILILFFSLLSLYLLAQNVPQNPVITRDGNTVELTWDTVLGADHYNIYRSSDPDAADWGDPAAQVTGLYHSEPASAAKYFYRVTSESGGTLPAFILVPGGTFTMGRTTGDGYSNELPTHSVTLSSFYMGKYEVTQAEYAAIMGSNPASGYGVGDNYPVYIVSWYAMLKYCNLRSMAEGLTPVYAINVSTDPATWGGVPTSDNYTWNNATCNFSANGYRLPTEAEWEYAARGATNTPDYLYAGANDINSVAWYNTNSGSINHTVGTKTPNGLGLFDMSGSVWERCWDRWGNYSSEPQTNPTGPAINTTYRVTRGGSWYYSADYCRVAYRSYFNSYSGFWDVGFRLCRTAS